MTSFSEFSLDHLLQFSAVNVDPFTETFGMSFYQNYLSKYPDYCLTASSSLGNISGYMIGKAEGEGELWHGHISAVTVSPSYRRMGLAKHLIQWIEDQSDNQRCYFVDLFVRDTNINAIEMYKVLGYVIYRTVLGYYMDPNGKQSNAYDMRKSLKQDSEKKSMIPLPYPITPDELEWR
ncbi:hypothetical protein GEMRC1_006549 [Eukaryota sp. GEM-RC1]